MVLQVLADAWEFRDDWDIQLGEKFVRAYAGKLEQLRAVDRASSEDHLASLDDALNDARVNAAPADVARLERTRAELLTSYTQLRYAERVSANF